MTTHAKLQSDPFEQLKQALEDAPCDHTFLAGYVRDLELHRQGEDTFLRLAFENASVGGASGGKGPFVVSVVSELYEPLSPERKIEIRRWWHDKVRHEAEQFDDLKTRLSGLR